MRPTPAPLRTAILLTAVGLTLPAQAAQVAFDDSWKEQRFSLFSSNDYGFDGDTLTVESDGTVSLAYSPLPDTLWSATTAAWDWSVTESVPASDLSVKGGDDRNLAMYFVFLPEAEADALREESVRKLLTNDAARVLPFIGTLLWVIPLLWPENGAAVRSSSAIIYLFGVWGLLVLGAGLLSWRLSVQAREGDPERDGTGVPGGSGGTP